MKRKFLSILSLVLAIAMILPMGVFVSADETQPLKISEETTDVTGKTIKKDYAAGLAVTLTASGGAGEGIYQWSSSNSSIASISSSGNTATISILKPGTVTITAESAGETKNCTIEINKVLESIAVTKEPTNKEYISGQNFDKTGMEVTARYNYGDDVILSSSDYTVEPSVLSVSNTYVTVKYGGKETTVNNIKVIEKVVNSVKINNLSSTAKFNEGDAIPKIELKVKYNDGSEVTMTSGYTVTIDGTAAGSTFKATDNGKTMTVTYGGQSDSVTLSITPKETETEKPSTEDKFTATVAVKPTKTTYKVGETFDPTGMTVYIYKNSTRILTLTATELKSIYIAPFATVSSNTTVTIRYTFTYEGTTRQVSFDVTGLKVEAATETLSVYEITAVEMEEKSYPVGYSFSLSDIEYFYYRERYSSTSYKVYGYDVINKKYSNTISLEVLNSKGNTKTSYRYASVIEEDDVLTDSKGNEYVTLLLTVDSVKYKFNVDVGSSGVYYYYDDDLIAIYEDIDEALKYTAKQDDDVDFDLEDVDDDEEILIKLGEDQKISSTFTLGLNHNVKIDLNGHILTFYTDTVDITKANDDYTLIITNTSSTAGKFIYYDKDVTMTVAKNEKLVFEYDKDIPGIYTVTLDVGSNGSVTTTPKASSDEITVGHGTDIKFTITPASGYSVNTIKADSKTVSSSDYTKASNGVVTYTLKAVSKSQKVEITFKKDETKWNNPFTDVRSTDSYYSAVQFVYENELFKGTTTTKFSPDTTMTRAMFVTVLGRLANVDVSRYKTSSYSDVPLNNDTAWYAPYVEWATNMGLVEGYGDGTFGPNNKITHQQMYVLMYRYTIFVENKSVSLKSTSINASDAEDVADWAKDAVKFASQNNFLVKISTTSSRIDPTGEAKRCELAQLLEQYCKIILEWKD